MAGISGTILKPSVNISGQKPVTVKAGNATSNDGFKIALYVILSVSVLLLLWQSKKLHPYVGGIGIIIMLGVLLRFYPTIRNQFVNLGG